jgi:hypothetical protein
MSEGREERFRDYEKRLEDVIIELSKETSDDGIPHAVKCTPLLMAASKLLKRVYKDVTADDRFLVGKAGEPGAKSDE